MSQSQMNKGEKFRREKVRQGMSKSERRPVYDEEREEEKERENDAAHGAVRRAKRSEEREEAGHCAIRKWLTTYTRKHG